MSKPLFLQLIASFIVGGAAVTVLTLVAERVHPRTAGIVLSLPTSMAVGLFFIGWVLSPAAVAEAAVGIPASLGASMLFVAVYVSIASLMRARKMFVMACAAAGGVLAWAVVAVPLAIYRLESVTLSMLLYVLTIVAAYLWLAGGGDRDERAVAIRYTVLQRAGRAVFAGTLIMLVVYLSRVLGPIWGGVFSAFPAAIGSGILILHWQRDARLIQTVYRTMPIGSMLCLIYTLIAVLAFPRAGLVAGTVLAYATCFAAAWLYVRISDAGRR